ncbi:MAG: hypothetical protein EOO93_29195 [Pedobacter sp.]|nr:MAG: hypothetical protein EOO93_29195 [Pedobacter sp.]
MLNGKEMSTEFVLLISTKLQQDVSERFLFENIRNYNEKTIEAVNLNFNFLLFKYLKKPSDQIMLAQLTGKYMETTTYQELYHKSYQKDDVKIPLEIAMQIMSSSAQYPRAIVYSAERACRRNANTHVVHVEDIAKKDFWFG